jgi:TRAP-type uncharacterized transport system substrate-binding protein
MTGTARPVPEGIQLMTESRYYMVDATTEGIDKLARTRADVFTAIFPQPIYSGDLQKSLGLRYDPVRQPVVYCFGGQNPHWVMSPEADEEVVHEFVSVLVKYREEFDRYMTGDVKAIKEGFPQVARSKDWFHPGAVRAFKEFGLDYGLSSLVPAEQQRARAHGLEFYLPDYMQARLRQ